MSIEAAPEIVEAKDKVAAKKVTKPASTHPTYKEMIIEALLSLKERNGSSRQAVKKYIWENNKGLPIDKYEKLISLAIKKGVEARYFEQPNGGSGTVKLVRSKVLDPKPKKSKSRAKALVTEKAASSTRSAPRAVSKRVAEKAVGAAKKSAVKKTVGAKKTATKKTASKVKAASSSGGAKPAKASKVEKKPAVKKSSAATTPAKKAAAAPKKKAAAAATAKPAGVRKSTRVA